MAGIHRKTRGNREAGQALYLAAVSLVVVAGLLGLGIDMGMLRYEKRLQQTAADAAAITGASDLRYGGVTQGAMNAAKTNGFADTGSYCTTGCPNTGDAGYVTVTVNSAATTGGPESGPHSCGVDPNCKDYVEVLVSAVHPTYFMRIFGRTKETVTTRAVAGNVEGGGPNGTCLYGLGLSAGVPVINASVALNLGACGISVNGIITGVVNAVNCLLSGCSYNPNTPAVADPLSYLSPPCSSCAGGVAWNGLSGNLSPGTYSSISIGPGAVTFSPGVYVIDGSGGLAIAPGATVSGTGVTFYFTNGATVNMPALGLVNVQLTAPTDCSGQYPGILFYQDPTDSATPVVSSGTYQGAMYFPGTTVTFGGIGSINAGIVVAGALNVNATLNLQGSAGLPSCANPVAQATLVE